MPSIASHFVCTKLVADILKIYDDDFYIGNILPDLLSNNDSHFKIEGSFYLVPDIEQFVKLNSVMDSRRLGYLCHLLLDKYFLEEFIPNYISNYKSVNIFTKEIIYDDYTKINYRLVLDFGLDVEYISFLLSNLNIIVDQTKLNTNLKNINNTIISNDLKVIDYDKYKKFLKDISIRIANDLMLYKEGEIL